MKNLKKCVINNGREKEVSWILRDFRIWKFLKNADVVLYTPHFLSRLNPYQEQSRSGKCVCAMHTVHPTAT